MSRSRQVLPPTLFTQNIFVTVNNCPQDASWERENEEGFYNFTAMGKHEGAGHDDACNV